MNEYTNDFYVEKHYLLNSLIENAEKSKVIFLESTKVSCLADSFVYYQTCIRYQEEWKDWLTDGKMFATLRAHLKGGVK